jgi:hypothetical protein
MYPHRLDTAAWQTIAAFERGLDRQVREMRAVLIREFSASPARTTKRKLTAPQSRSLRKN